MPAAAVRAVHVIGSQCRERFLAVEHAAARPLTDVGVQLAGISDLSRPYEMGRPDPSFHCVLYGCSGTGWLRVEGLPDRLQAGEVALIPAGTPSAYGIASAAWRLAWFHLAPSGGLGPALRGRRPSTHRAAHLPRLEAAMEGYLEEARGPDEGSRQAAALQAELIACYLQRELAGDVDPAVAEQRRRLQQLWDAVDRDLRHPWTVASLAARLHASEISLYRLCARHFSVQPMAMVTRMRMERARQLLRETDEPLKRVADWVGYRNEFAFSTAFKRFTGVSPRDFRRTARVRA